jgi:hypothetical protein
MVVLETKCSTTTIDCGPLAVDHNFQQKTTKFYSVGNGEIVSLSSEVDSDLF